MHLMRELALMGRLKTLNMRLGEREGTRYCKGEKSVG